MSHWQPLSVRRGLKPQPALYEGIPGHLSASVQKWIWSVCGWESRYDVQEGLVLQVARLAHVAFTVDGDGYRFMRQLSSAGHDDPDVMLNILDALLHAGGPCADPVRLAVILLEGGSAWTVRSDGRGLERRVDAATTSAFAEATTPADAASTELREAWSKAYGRNPDASDVWDHAIKAVEAVLIPIVCPNKSSATLGNVLGDIKANPARLTMKLATSSTTTEAVQTVEAMLRMIWPNPDRHGGTGPTRVPGLDEAQGVLQIAITIVHWVRIGVIS